MKKLFMIAGLSVALLTGCGEVVATNFVLKTKGGK
jgi:hypothetical protein